MASQEAVHPSIEEEAQEDHARVAEHHDKGHQRTPGAADLKMAEVAPVHLRVLARQRAQAQVGLDRWARAQPGRHGAEVRGAAHKNAFADHGVQPRRGERGVLGQRLLDEGPVRVDAAGAQRRRMDRRAVARHNTAHDVAVHVQPPGDGAHAPLLDGVQPLDLRNQVRCGPCATPGGPRDRGAGSPNGPNLAVAYCSAGTARAWWRWAWQ